MDINPYIGAALLALTGVLIGRWLDERRFRATQKAAAALQPSQIQASEAETEHSRAETAGILSKGFVDLGAQVLQQGGVIFNMQMKQNELTLEVGQLKTTVASQAVVIVAQNSKLDSQAKEIVALKAENAELKQRIVDYPKRVQDLEGIIAQLRDEIHGLQGASAHNADARLLEQQNMQTALAAVPAAAAPVPNGLPSAPPAETPPTESSKTVAVKVNGELIETKPASKSEDDNLPGVPG
jgi:cell division protein FtsB